MEGARPKARWIVQEFLARGDATGWFGPSMRRPAGTSA